MADEPVTNASAWKGRDLIRAHERFIAAILRGPGLAAAVRMSGLDRQHIHPELHFAFEFAIRSDRDQIRRALQIGEGEVARLYRLGVELGYAQVSPSGAADQGERRKGTRITNETHGRSIAKAVSWRAAGSLDTFILAVLITGSSTLAGGIALAEVLTKTVLYYLHERFWALIPWGRR